MASCNANDQRWCTFYSLQVKLSTEIFKNKPNTHRAEVISQEKLWVYGLSKQFSTF